MFRRLKWLLCIAALAVLGCFALSNKLAVRSYTVASEKITGDMTLCVVSDLHNCFYGENQAELCGAIHAAYPDAVLIVGDVCSGTSDFGGMQALLDGLGGRYPVYYVSGNHESDTGELAKIKKLLQTQGVHVLEGDSRLLSANGSTIRIAGLDDPISLTREEWSHRLESLQKEAQDGVFTVLLSHRPDRADRYSGFDLVLCGHAHGGQVRIPGLLNGLWAPNQGWFPKYAGGEYALDDVTMIVSRGLEKSRAPRIFNRPELVVVKLEGTQSKPS